MSVSNAPNLQAESLRTKCRHELSQAKKLLKDLEICFKKERSISREETHSGSSRVNPHDAPKVLCPQVKQILVDCLRVKSVVIPVTGEKKDLDTWYTRYLGSSHSSSRRRVLAEAAGGQPDPLPTILMAVGVTAAVTFLVSILLFYFCCAGSFAAGRNDERPLLSLSLSDNSIGTLYFLHLFRVS